MAHSPIAVANSFIDIARRNGVGITPMKLQKLVYYAHGWSLGILGEPLIDGVIEAWKYGPVIDSIYHEFKHYGSDEITQPATVFDFGSFELIEPRIEGDETSLSLIAKVWDEYGRYSAITLSSMTHAAGSPWEISREGRDEARSVPISNEVIRDYFEKLAVRNRNNGN